MNPGCPASRSVMTVTRAGRSHGDEAALLKLAAGAQVVVDLHCDKDACLYVYAHVELWPSARDLAARLGAAAVLL